jgi:hypothetical protein
MSQTAGSTGLCWDWPRLHIRKQRQRTVTAGRRRRVACDRWPYDLRCGGLIWEFTE